MTSRLIAQMKADSSRAIAVATMISRPRGRHSNSDSEIAIHKCYRRAAWIVRANVEESAANAATKAAMRAYGLLWRALSAPSYAERALLVLHSVLTSEQREQAILDAMAQDVGRGREILCKRCSDRRH